MIKLLSLPTCLQNALSIERLSSIYRRLLRSWQLGGLVLVFRLGVPLRCKASKLWYPLCMHVCYSSVKYEYQASTQLRYQSFDNHLENKPRVGTPIRQSLPETYFNLKDTVGHSLGQCSLFFPRTWCRKDNELKDSSVCQSVCFWHFEDIQINGV